MLGQLGTYGDLFGALNCLFSGAALWGVVYAVILQRRELSHQHDVADDARWSTEIQNRLSLYQYLADQHRQEGSRAGEDILLAARSKGRAKAYTEMISGLLRELEAGEHTAQRRPIKLYDHPARIAVLTGRYRELEDEARDVSNLFAPVTDLLLGLVEEVAALTELNRSDEAVAAALLEAGHAINAAIRPQDLLEPEQLDDPGYHRNYQLRMAREGFAAAKRALDAFRDGLDRP